jgi:predicted SAM-dependent methyltransferase
MTNKYFLPLFIRLKLRNVEKVIRYSFRRILIRIPIVFDRPINIILGAALTYQKGWYSTNEQWLDITKESDWLNVFKNKVLIKNIVVEHVLEHLTYSELNLALVNIYKHMLPGARLRIAVPDGYNPNKIYIKNVGINGIGPDASDHKQLLNYDILSKTLLKHRFEVELLEGYISNGDLTIKPYDPLDGYIKRSRSNQANMKNIDSWDFKDAETSLIIDAFKTL